jgi:hypothetical protein
VQLVEFSRFIAGEVEGGHYPCVEYCDSERWHQRIYRDLRVDVWLISWLPSQGTQLHDHGGSGGAFTVLSGELSEAVYGWPRVPADGKPRRLGEPMTEHQRAAGDAVGFGPNYVHDVRNLSDAAAVSVHAYSPPLSSMNYFDLARSGQLRRIATLATEDPESVVKFSDRPSAENDGEAGTESVAPAA